MDLSDILLAQTTLLEQQPLSGRKTLFELIGKLVSEQHPDIKAQHVAQAIQAREKLGSTAIGFGVAIPHARLPGLEQPVAVLIHLKSPIFYDDDDQESVDLIFSLLVPEDATEQHLQLLASIAKRLSETKYRDALRAATSSQQLFDEAIKES